MTVCPGNMAQWSLVQLFSFNNMMIDASERLEFNPISGLFLFNSFSHLGPPRPVHPDHQQPNTLSAVLSALMVSA